MVIEGVLTTENADGSMHVSPIGPHVNAELSSWTLKPFQSSTTFANLRASSRAVFHVVDDPLLMAARSWAMQYESTSSIADSISPESPLGRPRSDQRTDCSRSSQAEIGLGTGFELSILLPYRIEQWDVSTPRAIAALRH